MKRYILFLFTLVALQCANAVRTNVDGLYYTLNRESHEAVISYGNTCSGDLDIPSEVIYEGEVYVVKSMIWNAFNDCSGLTKVKIPKTLESIMHGYPYDPDDPDVPAILYLSDNPFIGCTALESIEVDEENPGMKSVGGVLFSKDGTSLYAYPSGIKAASYDVPEGVVQIGAFALANDHLRKIDLAGSVQRIVLKMCADASLDTLIVRGRNVEDMSMRGWFLKCLKETAKLYVPDSEVDRYKSLYSGTVLPLEEYEGRKVNQEYFPEGTKWTEIRLDTLKYDSWYSKVGDEWMPNFETIEYRVEGEYTDQINGVYNCVYTNGPEWTDSLTLLIYKWETDGEILWNGAVTVAASDDKEQLLWPFCGQMYPLSWEVGTPMSSLSIEIAGATGGGWPWEWDEYGTVEEIKEGDFGGVRPLKYSDVNGIRFIQGIGVASWNDGECIFGPIRPYEVLSHLGAVEDEERHYRSMLVHFERDGEVLYDVWPEKETEEDPFQEYYPEGTKWTEIRLDTLKYDSWYSKVGDEWVPNFETIEYLVEGDYTGKWGNTYKCVYSNAPEWMGTPLLIKETDSEVSVSLIYDKESKGVLWDAQAYQFDWSIGKGLYYKDMLDANSTGIVPYYFFYGVIDEIKEGDFGGVRPLKYVDLNGKAATLEFGYCIDTKGGRIIQGIGITEWNDGECLFGPPNPYLASLEYGGYTADVDRHYRSMLVHFERDGEVLYDVWPEKEATEASVTFTEGQMATVILPSAPDASKGKYYRLDRVDGNEIVFEQELQPRAHVPYIIVPYEDFSIDPGTLDLDGCRPDTASISGIRFIGTYCREELPALSVGTGGGFRYIDIIDTTPDCREDTEASVVGALRAYLEVDPSALNWDDPYHPGGTKSPRKEEEKMPVVLKDSGTSIHGVRDEMANSKLPDSIFYDLSGRRIVNSKSSNGKLSKGVYIKDGKKVMK